MLNVLFALLLLAVLAFLAWRVAQDREWKLPAGLAAAGAGLAYWFKDIADKIGGWF